MQAAAHEGPAMVTNYFLLSRGPPLAWLPPFRAVAVFAPASARSPGAAREAGNLAAGQPRAPSRLQLPSLGCMQPTGSTRGRRARSPTRAALFACRHRMALSFRGALSLARSSRAAGATCRVVTPEGLQGEKKAGLFKRLARRPGPCNGVRTPLSQP